MKQKWKLFAVVLTLAAAALCSVLSPRVLGMATNQIFYGITDATANGTTFSVNLITMGAIIFAYRAVSLGHAV